MTAEEGFQAPQNGYWWLHSEESAAASVYLGCQPLHLCTGMHTMAASPMLDMSVGVAIFCRKISAYVMK